VARPQELRFITYLSPGIPQSFFGAIIDHVRRTLGCERTSLQVEEERIRVIESWGPFPIQPVVFRSALPPELKKTLRASLLMVDAEPHTRRALSRFGLRRFVSVSDEDYSPALFAHAGISR
jgi:ABC-type phosphate/phosphonate transport system substrate-binding protein